MIWDIFVDSSIVVALFGVIASVISYIAKNKRESKRSAKRLLYIMLEIRRNFHLSIIDTETEVKKILGQLNTVLINKGMTEDLIPELDFIEANSKTHFDNVIHASKTDLKCLLGSYKAALDDLSSDYPIAAYFLAGKETVEKIAEISSLYFDQMEGELINKEQNAQDKNLLKTVNSFGKNKTKDKLVKDIDESILELAKFCGRKELRKTKIILEEPSGLDHYISQMESQLDELFSHVFSHTQIKTQVEK